MTVFLGNCPVNPININIDYETINKVWPICEHGSNLTFGRCVLCDVKKTKKPIGPTCTHGEHPQLCQICMSEKFNKAMTVRPRFGYYEDINKCMQYDYRNHYRKSH